MYLSWGWIIFLSICIWYMGYNAGKNDGIEEAKKDEDEL